MKKNFNRLLSIMLALVMSVGTALTVSSEAVTVASPDEPIKLEWTEETQTDEFEVRADVVGKKVETNKSDAEKVPAATYASTARAAKLTPNPSGGSETESAEGTSGELTWKYDGETKTLTISGEGEMENYSYSYRPDAAPWIKKDIETIIIENGVTSIGAFAFYSCDMLTSVTIPDSVVSIGDYSFYKCYKLTSIDIPDSVVSIESYAFCDCDRFTDVTIPDSVTSIGDRAFLNCSNLKSISLPNSITSISAYMLADCPYLTSVFIPDSVMSIGDHAFSNCTSLTGMTIPDSVTSINSYAFSGCARIKSMTIPVSITNIESYVFSECIGLTSITLPDSVTSIESYAFSQCTNLTSIKLPDSVTSIGSYAFSQCTNLTNITIPDSVTSIGDRAFCYCTGLTSITIPDSVTSIGSSAFSYCTGLTSITIPDSVTSIGNHAFSYCTSLSSIKIPNSVKNIGAGAFYCCERLESIVVPDSITIINGNVFNSCTGLTSITIPDSVTSIGNYAFSGCTGLTSITLPDSVTSIGNHAFSDCTSLSSIKLPDSVTSIGSYAFSGCTSITSLTSITIPDFAFSCDGVFARCSSIKSITIPDSVTSIGEYAFSGCTGLESITLPDSITSIGREAFSKCTGLTSITIPDSVTWIEYYVFSGCTGLTNIVLPNSVRGIGYSAFSGCTGLTSITIPNSVTSIGYSVFFGCTGLTSITIPDSVTSIGYSAFYACTGLTSIYIPDTVTSIDNDVFLGCNDLTIFCSPGSAAFEYADANGIDFEFILIGEANGIMTVNIDERYIGSTLRIYTVNKNGSTVPSGIRKIDKSHFALFGLNPYCTYKAEIVSDIGSVFGTVDNITLTDDAAEITFTDTKPICNITAAVKASDNSDMTELCTIKWYKENGEYIKTGTSLDGAAQGDTFKYTVELKKSMLKLGFLVPEEQTVTVESESTTVECMLRTAELCVFSGKVTDENGNALIDADVSFTQEFGSGESKTLTASTNGSGSFSFEAKKVPSSLTVRKNGYSIYSEDMESVDDAERTITLTKMQTGSVAVDLTRQDIDSEPEKAEFFGSIDFTVYNKTTGKEIKNISTSFPNLILPLDEVNEGDEISVKASLTDYNTAQASFIFGTDSSVSLELVSKGRLVLLQRDEPADTNMAVIFDKSGKYVNTVKMKKKTPVYDLAAGDYTVIMMTMNYRYYAPASFNDFGSYALKEGVDYARADVTIENAKRTTADNIVIPVLDDSKGAYLDADRSSVSINKSSVSLGHYVSARIDYAFKDDVNVSDAKIVLSLPESFTVKPNGITLNNKTVLFTESDGSVIIDAEETSGTLRMALFAVRADDNCSFEVKTEFTEADHKISESIGAFMCTAVNDSVDFYIPSVVNDTKVYCIGKAYPNKKLMLFDNDVLAGTAVTDYEGDFELEFELVEPYKNSTHEIYLAFADNSGALFYTNKKTIHYACDNVVAKTLHITHRDFDFSINLTEKQAGELWYQGTISNCPRVSFEVEFDGDASKAHDVEVITRTPYGQYIHVPLAFDKRRNTMVGSYDYTLETYPTAFSVYYLLDKEELFDYEQMMEKVEQVEALAADVDSSMEELKAAGKEIENGYHLTKTELIETLRSNGCTDEEIAQLDLDYIIKSIDSAVSEFKDELWQNIQDYIDNELPDGFNENCTELMSADFSGSDSSVSDCSVIQLSENATAQTYIENGYTEVKTYDDIATLLEKRNPDGTMDLIDLNRNVGYIYGSASSKLPSSSGAECCDDCPPYHFEFSTFAMIMEKLNEANKWIEDLTGYLNAEVTAINIATNTVSTVTVNSAKAGAVAGAIVEGLDSNCSRNVIEALKHCYKDGAFKEIDNATNGLQKILGYLGNVADFISTIADVLDFAEMVSQIKELQSQCCKCCKTAIQSLNEALSFVKSGVFKTVGYLVLSFLPYVGTVLGIVSSVAGFFSWFTGSDSKAPDPILEPINYSKHQAKVNIDFARRFLEFECKCEEEDHEDNKINVNCHVDPSGYICEAVDSNRIEGVTSTLFYSKTQEGTDPVMWNAWDYGQSNPFISDSNGHYEWYVPEGWWQVKFEKAGYETTYSDWVPVLPIQTEVNVEMKSLYAPKVTNVKAYPDGIDITFSHYMALDTVSCDRITVTADETPISGKIVPLNEEASFADETVSYASKFRFVPDEALSGKVKVSVEKVKAYNDLYIDSPYSAYVDVEERIESVDVPESITMDYDQSTDVEIRLLPGTAASGKTVKVTSSSDKLLSVDTDTIITSKSGTAKIGITGHLPSQAELTFTVDGYDISASTIVKLEMPKQEEMPMHHDTDSESDHSDIISSDSDTNSDSCCHHDSDTDESSDTETETNTDSGIDSETIVSDNDSANDSTDSEESSSDINDNIDSDSCCHHSTDSDNTESDVSDDSDSDISDNGSDSDTDSCCEHNETPDEPQQHKNLGDIDGDGDITANDALTVLRASVGIAELTPEQFILADVDGDGDITANDALAILRFSVGLGVDGNIGKTIAA